MADAFAIKRLQKEYKALMKNPIPLMTAVPDPNNVLSWFYILKGEDGSEYEGGYYFGRLDFKSDYPKSPPAIRMITPSGKFNPGKSICMTNTEYYSKLNPTWSAKSILLGFQSFFYDDNDPGTGVIYASKEQRKQFAKDSMNFNNKQTEFKRIFPEMPEITDGSNKDEESVDNLSDSMNKNLNIDQKGSGYRRRNMMTRYQNKFKMMKINRYVRDYETNKLSLNEFKSLISKL